MSETTTVVIIGLLFQLSGALLIINPLFFWKTRKSFNEMKKKYDKDMDERRKKPQAEIYSDIEELAKRLEEEKEKFIRAQFKEILVPSRIIWGIILLVIGFGLQIGAELYR